MDIEFTEAIVLEDGDLGVETFHTARVVLAGGEKINISMNDDGTGLVIRTIEGGLGVFTGVANSIELRGTSRR